MRATSTFVISLTPFTSDGALDEAALRAHLRRLGAAGIGVYLAGSGSGEGYTLSRAERGRIFAIGAEELGGRVPVRAMGVEPRTADEVIALARDAQDAGLDAAQVYSLDMGHGYRPTGAELREYLATVLGATDFPLVLSTHQSVGYHYEPALVGELLDRHHHVVGVNVTHPDLTYVAAMIDAVAERADVHVGGPMQALSALALGGVVGAKAALALLGAPGGAPRRPRLAPDATRARELVELLASLGLVGSEGLDGVP